MGIRIFLYAMIWTGSFILLILVGSYSLVSLKGSQNLHFTVESLPEHEYGVVLGTSRLLRSGQDNPFFRNRIEAAAKLYKAGKIEKILLSGDFSPPYYNEPRDMKNALEELGVPESDLLLDSYGFRTYHSIVRAQNAFNADSFIVISQNFHTQRALFISRLNGIPASGFAADDPSLKINRLSAPYIREFFARVRSVWDCYFVSPEVDMKV